MAHRQVVRVRSTLVENRAITAGFCPPLFFHPEFPFSTMASRHPQAEMVFLTPLPGCATQLKACPTRLPLDAYAPSLFDLLIVRKGVREHIILDAPE